MSALNVVFANGGLNFCNMHGAVTTRQIVISLNIFSMKISLTNSSSFPFLTQFFPYLCQHIIVKIVELAYPDKEKPQKNGPYLQRKHGSIDGSLNRIWATHIFIYFLKIDTFRLKRKVGVDFYNQKIIVIQNHTSLQWVLYACSKDGVFWVSSE